jgi:hypothetical protein
MRDGGKGVAPRPLSIPMEEFDKNFDAIFGVNKLAEKIIRQTEEAIKREKEDGNKTNSNE